MNDEDDLRDIMIVDEQGNERPAPFGPSLDDVLDGGLKGRVKRAIRRPSVQKVKRKLPTTKIE